MKFTLAGELQKLCKMNDLHPNHGAYQSKAMAKAI